MSGAGTVRSSENRPHGVHNLDEIAIPPLRPDLEMFEAPCEMNGSPVWMIRDPVTSRFEKAGYIQKIVLDCLDRPRRLGELHDLINNISTFPVEIDELAAFCKGLIAKKLTVATLQTDPERLMEEKRAAKVGVLRFLLKNYLYFRIPLIHPDAFLEKNLHWARLFSCRTSFFLYSIIAILGLYFLLSRFDEYIHTFPRFYNFQGVASYGIAICAIKILHEFSHAFTAKSFGVRVPTMGVAFMVMFPVPYCDVTDGWRLKSRLDRLLISSAGIICELVIAGLSLFLWAMSDDGLYRSLFFVISSVTIAGTLLVNLNPGMRYDGYYIFSDLIGVDNLQSRAVLLLKWFWRKTFLNFRGGCPEEGMSKGRLFSMAAYAVYAACYRFMLYISIAILVYYAFDFKLLGAILFLVEIFVFIVRPFIVEGKELFALRRHLAFSFRLLLVISVLSGFLAWMALPLSRTEKIPAIIVPGRAQTVYAPFSGIITEMFMCRDADFRKGQTLFRLVIDNLDQQIQIAEIQMTNLQHELEILPNDERSRSRLIQTSEALAHAQAELSGLMKMRAQTSPKALFDSHVYYYDDLVRPGSAVSRQQKIAVIADTDDYKLLGYVPERIRNLLAFDVPAFFIADMAKAWQKVKITKMHSVKEEYLRNRNLSSLESGEMAVVADTRGRLKLMDSYYELDASFDEDSVSSSGLHFDLPGILFVKTKPYSLLAYWFSSLFNILIRESSL